MFNSKNYVQDKTKDSQRSIDGNKAAA